MDRHGYRGQAAAQLRRGPARPDLLGGFGLDLLGLAFPWLILIVSIISFASIWAVQGWWSRAAGGAAGIAYYGGVSVMFGFPLYLAGYGVARVSTVVVSATIVLSIAGAMLVGSLIGGIAALYGGHGNAAAAFGVAFFVCTPAFGATVASAISLKQVSIAPSVPRT